MPHFRLSRSALVIIIQLLILFLLTLSLCIKSRQAAAESFLPSGESPEARTEASETKKDYIHWVDFDVTAQAMEKAFRYDMETCQADIHLDWIDLLAFLGARYGGDFSRFQAGDMDALAERLKNGETIEELTKDMKYFSYYHEAYSAVLGGMVGYFRQEIDDPGWGSLSEQAQAGKQAGQASQTERAGQTNQTEQASQTNQTEQAGQTSQAEPAGQAEQTEQAEPVRVGQTQPAQAESQATAPGKIWVTKYGLRAFSPIAKGFPYSDYDDFGVARSYGYKRQHLGHDMMGQVGTPVIAVESGYVEAIGWNQYGGWRIGIRSFDKKRYYYYAHLRQNYPYQSSLSEGSVVTSGDVIGYLGRTGYSATENTNNISTPHLHFGLQLIFDESQKEGNNEIWVNCYELVKFLHMNQSQVVKVEGTKEWTRVYDQEEDGLPDPEKE